MRELPAALEDWWADYLRSLKRTGGRSARRERTDATVRIYRAQFEEFWTFALARGVADPGDVDHRLVNEWTDSMIEQVQPSTVAIRWRNARPFWSWWAKETESTNPFVKADVPGAPTPEIPVIPLEDIRKLLDACRGSGFDERRDTAVIMVLADTGVRLGELVGLKVDDWDRRGDVLHVDGKTGRRRVQHGAATGEAISRYLRARTGHPKATTTEALWIGHKGAWGVSGPTQMLRRRCAQAEIERVHPHQFRHTWAHNAKGSLELGDLMYLAGWKTVTMANRYGSSAAAERARAAYRPNSVGDRL